MDIIFLTSNANKLREARAILGADFNVLQQPIELDEIQSNSAEEVIGHKIKEARAKLPGVLFFIEDTCLYLGLDREIGPLIKFLPNHRAVKAYLGESAQAVCTIGLSSGEIFQGVIEGKIVEPRGETKFQWDPIFQPEGYDKTFAEMTAVEKNTISMRRLAFEKLRGYLEGQK
jgi:inosine triphosphate pyrophosphatase